jgi:hypothetical protein
MSLRTVREARGSHAFLSQPFQVDVGADQPCTAGKALRFGEHLTVLTNQGMTVPGEIRRGLTVACCGIEIGGNAFGRLAGTEQPAVIGFATRHVAGGQIAKNARACKRGVATGWNRHPQVLADLGMYDEVRITAGNEQHIGAERRAVTRKFDLRGQALPSAAVLTFFIELAVIRQIALWHDAEQRAAMNDQGAIEQFLLAAHRRTDNEQRPQAAAAGEQAFHRQLDRVQQRVLLHKIVDRVRRYADMPSSGNSANTAPLSAACWANSRVRAAFTAGTASSTAGVPTATRTKPWE